LLPVIRAGGEALLRLADYLEQQFGDEAAPIAEGHVRNAELGGTVAVDQQ
jgi:hypothetical protein